MRAGGTAVRFINLLDLWHRRFNVMRQLATKHDRARPDGNALLTRPHTERGCVLPNQSFQQPRDQCANPMGMKADGFENDQPPANRVRT